MFPYSGKTSFSTSADPDIAALMSAHAAVEDVILGMLNLDSNLKVLAHFENTLTPQTGPAASGSGAIRYWSGKFSGSGVLIEGGATNLVSNPSAEVDVSTWAAVDGSVALSRDSSQFYNANNTVSAAAFKIAGTGNAGSSYISSTITVSPSTNYSASVYVYAPAGSTSKAMLELAFTGGTPVSSNSGNVTLTAGGWTRIKVENVSSTNNTSVAVRVYLTQRAPAFLSGSRLSTLSPTATAAVTDAAMSITTGDLCMCAVTANPGGPPAYSWHMVTTGATGVNSASLRIDDKGAAPTFVTGTQFSKISPAGGDSVAVTDSALSISAGDLVFCNLTGVGYAWHMVTTGATGANSSSLRLDDSASAPNYVSGSRLTRIAPSATAAVTDAAMSITAGDMVYCRVLANPSPSGSNPVYAWHMVTTGATGVNSASLRLDNATAAPTYATGSRFSRKAASASGTDTDNAATLTAGDFAFAYPTKNPAASGYSWHLITTGSTGVANGALRIDQTSSETIWADCIQLEAGSVATSFADSYQGAGYSGALGSSVTRTASKLSYPTSGVSLATAGTVGFWMYPLWSAADGKEHVLFDIAIADEQDRIRLTKDINNNLVLSVYDTNGGLKQLTTNSSQTFLKETWQHIVFTFNAGTLAMYLNGSALASTSSGSGTGQITNTASQLYVGSDYNGGLTQGAVFDDLFISTAAMLPDAISKIGTDSGQYLGLAAARKGFDIGHGNATTHASAGTQTSVSHGLGVTPAFIEITERGNGVVYLSQTSDATSFYVTGSANALNFDWRAFA